MVKLTTPAQRAAWIAAQLDSIEGSGIIYTLTVANAHDIATLLRDRGHKVAAYTGATDPAEREQLEADLLDNRVKALVATSALGMASSFTSEPLPRPSRTTSRSAVRAEPPSAQRSSCCQATRTRTSGVTSLRWRFRQNPWCAG